MKEQPPRIYRSLHALFDYQFMLFPATEKWIIHLLCMRQFVEAVDTRVHAIRRNYLNLHARFARTQETDSTVRLFYLPIYVTIFLSLPPNLRSICTEKS